MAAAQYHHQMCSRCRAESRCLAVSFTHTQRRGSRLVSWHSRRHKNTTEAGRATDAAESAQNLCAGIAISPKVICPLFLRQRIILTDTPWCVCGTGQGAVLGSAAARPTDDDTYLDSQPSAASSRQAQANMGSNEGPWYIIRHRVRLTTISGRKHGGSMIEPLRSSPSAILCPLGQRGRVRPIWQARGSTMANEHIVRHSRQGHTEPAMTNPSRAFCRQTNSRMRQHAIEASHLRIQV